MSRLSLSLGIAGGLLLIAAWVPWPEFTSGPAAPAPAANASVDYGRALFVAKGCSGCHRHDEVLRRQTGGFWGWDNAPDLTRYTVDAAFVRTWLRDPKSVRPATTMPDFNLSEQEIDALIVFLSASES